MQRQLWRLQDLGDGGGLGFTVELFFLALSQLLSTSSSKDSHSALYTGTFRAITSDWSKHKHSLGTQKLLLGIAVSRRQEFDENYPDYIVDEFLLLLGNIFEGQTGPHINEARQQIESYTTYPNRRFREGVLRVLTWGQAQSPAS
jgi:glycerol uptake facilitator-like aquaporin